MKKSWNLMASAILFLTFTVSNTFSQKLPDRPVPPRLVNDFAGMLNAEDVNMLERKLVAFNDSTSTQIAIAIVPSLEGYDPGDYAQRLGEKWGVGQKGKNNGILILIKPNTSGSKGEVFIATGYGAEGRVPDMVCGEIVDKEILPAFRAGDYYGGIDKATNTLMSLIRGEYSAADYGRRAGRTAGKGIPVGLIIFIGFIIIAMIGGKSGGSRNKNISSGGLPLWLLLGMMNSGSSSHNGSWGGFSGGGGGGGGFGGFGGGSFGGGGAGGSW
jgi:uncharacterized protein